MGYTLTIGELHCEEDLAELFMNNFNGTYYVPTVRLEDAPAFGEFTDYTNERMPSYAGWADVTKHTGMTNLMEELMPTGVGFAHLTEKHHHQIKEILHNYRTKIGFDKKPGYNEGEDPALGRLIWMEYWISWALKNCKKPVFLNT